MKERKFKLEYSVFKEWKPDTPESLEKMLKSDFSQWKCGRFIKDEYELEEVKKVVSAHIGPLKEVFHMLAARSSYPGIGWNEFTSWAQHVKLPDDKCPMSTIDRAFIAANVVLEGGAKGSDNHGLNRFQFLEILVRLSKAKFLETGLADKIAEALSMLVAQILKFEGRAEWQGFREQQLWTVAVNDLMEPNIPGLKLLYEKFFESSKRFMDFKDADTLFHKQTGILGKDSDVTYCFALSKMTVVKESESAFYNRLSFAEFLEMVGRVAYFKF